MNLWRSDQKSSPRHNSKCRYIRKNSWQPTCHFWILHTFCGKHRNQYLSLKTTNPLNVSFRQKIFQIFQIQSLWNGWDCFLRLNFKVANIAVSVNTAADFFSRLEFKVMQKIRLKIREVVQTTAIEVKASSRDVVDEELFFFTQTDCEDEIG